MNGFMRRALAGLLLLFLALPIFAQEKEEQEQGRNRGYSEVFYKSGDLSIQAYLYKPEGDGPFPVVIYNHGSRLGNERRGDPAVYIGRMLTWAGFAVMVPERRGYGRSEGTTLSQDIGRDRGTAMIARLQADTDDVLAAAEYLRGVRYADTNRMGIMGWSFGGVITTLAISRSSAFRVAVNQAGGALTWPISRPLQEALIDAAQKTTTPVLLLVAQNDRTTASITTLAEIFKKRGVPHRMVIYEPFTPRQAGGRAVAPGHVVFSAQGTHVWERDVLEFLARYLGATSKGAPSGADPAKSQQ
jgi:dienelactone hydrolase